MPYKDKEKANESRRRYYRNHREEELQKSKDWVKNNREKVNARARKWYHKNKDKAEFYRKKHAYKYVINRRNAALKRNYGNDILEISDRLFEERGGRCPICGRHQSELKKSLCVDHNHKTNQVRGRLCDKCNKALGLFEVDEYGIDLLCSAISYLKNSDELCKDKVTRPQTGLF